MLNVPIRQFSHLGNSKWSSYQISRIKFSSCGFHWTGTSLEKFWDCPPPTTPLRLPPPCSYLFLPLFPFTLTSQFWHMWNWFSSRTSQAFSYKECPRGRMKPSGPCSLPSWAKHHPASSSPLLGCPSTRPDTPWGQGLSVINLWISTFYSVMQAENLPGVFVKWLRNGSDVQAQCTSSYLLIAESLLGTVQNQFFQRQGGISPTDSGWKGEQFPVTYKLFLSWLITGESLYQSHLPLLCPSALVLRKAPRFWFHFQQVWPFVLLVFCLI